MVFDVPADLESDDETERAQMEAAMTETRPGTDLEETGEPLAEEARDGAFLEVFFGPDAADGARAERAA